MPTYEYECETCEHAFEEFQSMTARPLRKCPECGERSLRRLIGAGAGLIFKGSGFYETDYRSASYKKAAEAEKSAQSSKSDKKSDGASGKTKPKAGNPDAKKAATASKSG
ncbi:MAG: zinc ribbon domain-containing protein [Phycisphaerales bacterium]|nr:zinc ribbon domain-containing protein [Phycisphaerales bacterium]